MVAPSQFSSVPSCKLGQYGTLKFENYEQWNESIFVIIFQLDGLGGFNEFLDGDGSGLPDGFGNWCDRKFGKLAVVGMGMSNQDEMDNFASVNRGDWPGSTFVSLNTPKQDHSRAKTI